MALALRRVALPAPLPALAARVRAHVGGETSLDARRLWTKYQRRGRLENRLERVLPAAVLYALLGVCLLFLFPAPFKPFRGEVSLWADRVLGTLSFSLLVVLTFFVVDATLLCRWFVEALSARETRWPEPLLTRHSQERNQDPGHLPEWLDMRLIVDRTKVVGQLIYYPFLILLVLIAARSSYFDHWDRPMSVVLMYGIVCLFAVYCAITLLQAAEKTRRNELSFLRKKLLVAKGHDDRKRLEQLKQVNEEIEELQEGAFAPFTQQPLVRALLLVPGGTGVLSLAELLAWSS